MSKIRNTKDLIVGTVICGVQVLVPAVVTVVNFALLR